MNKEFSSGAAVFKIINDIVHYLILQSNQNIWGFPKGHINKDETEEQASSREIFEETGLKGEFIQGFIERMSYDFILKDEKINKNVVLFLFKAEDKPVKTTDLEHKDHKWLPYEQAKERLTYDDSKIILTKAHQFLINT